MNRSASENAREERAAPVRPRLRRSLSLPLITLYGIGTIVGGGIYALLGKVAGETGMAAPTAFLLAACVAVFSAISFAELCARFPLARGRPTTCGPPSERAGRAPSSACS